MSLLAVTSCGTDIGKTFISCALLHEMRARGRRVAALKPVISGMQGVALEATDSGRLLAALGEHSTQDNVARISPWQFAAPLTPSMAARLEGKIITPADIIRWVKDHDAPDTLTLVEGAGGVMAPLSDETTMRDFFAELSAPIILVVGCYLGSISHALTAYHALLPQHVLAMVVSDAKNDQGVGLKATCDELRRFVPASLPVLPIPHHPHQPDVRALADLVETVCY